MPFLKKFGTKIENFIYYIHVFKQYCTEPEIISKQKRSQNEN